MSPLIVDRMGLPPVARQNETMTSSLLGRGGTITLEKWKPPFFREITQKIY